MRLPAATDVGVLLMATLLLQVLVCAVCGHMRNPASCTRPGSSGSSSMLTPAGSSHHPSKAMHS
jgi:hypothetical protein